MSRGSTCFTRHWFTPLGGHGVPRPTKMALKIEKKVFVMPYTQQGVSGGSGWILRTLPLQWLLSPKIPPELAFPSNSPRLGPPLLFGAWVYQHTHTTCDIQAPKRRGGPGA
jgi:hypothetical protein